MEWFLMAIMSLTYDGGLYKDVYIWQNPNFESSEQCLEYVQNNKEMIHVHAMSVFPGDKIDRLLCVHKDKLAEFLEKAPAPNTDPA